jgi:ATP-dependent helicase HrpB
VLALPIDSVLPELHRALESARAVVLEAPPGAGKTTRVPWAVCEWLGGEREVLVSEPRRLAARMAAHRVASERASKLGERVGYCVRFEEVAGPHTRVRYATEGIVLRRLLSDPELARVGAVVLDEFHERHVTTDLLLVLLNDLSKKRKDLKLIVMSATLDAEPVARFLDDCPRVRSEGRLFPVNVEFLSKADDRPLEKQVVSAVRSALTQDPDGDVLVFLPGAGEIKRAQTALEPLAAEHGLLVLPLHGDLPIAEQARAIEPAGRRKVVLSTNVAESSVTVDGVTTVVDSGLARVAGHSPWSGLPRLSLEPISRASATQRAGRAGRTRAGRVLRLYTKGDFESRAEHDLPELARSDLAEAFLQLHGAGIERPEAIDFLSAPPAASVTSAAELLVLLGAVQGGKLSEIGRRMLDFPLPPRLARMLVEGERRGVGKEAALCAALLSEREIVLAERTSFGERRKPGFGFSGPSDVLERVERYHEAEDARFENHRLRNFGLDARAVDAVRRSHSQLARLVRSSAESPGSLDAVDIALQRALLTGFSDRLARRKRRASRELTLATGGAAELSEQSVVTEAEFVLAIDVEERLGTRQGGARVRLCSAVEPDWLLESCAERVAVTDELEWNDEAARVERIERLAFGSVVLEETRSKAPPSEAASALLLTKASNAGLFDFAKNERLATLHARLALLERELPETGLKGADSGALEQALAAACQGATSFAELRELDPTQALLGSLSGNELALLEREVPERLRLPGGRSVDVHYERDKPPWVESRLQDFFGMRDGPKLCRGRTPLTLHLLAPNQRAVQVTSDLAGFWQRHYPSIRRELMRRYPRHAWPEDGATAKPPEPRPPRR